MLVQAFDLNSISAVQLAAAPRHDPIGSSAGGTLYGGESFWSQRATQPDMATLRMSARNRLAFGRVPAIARHQHS